jgi:hypothetical protein
MQPLPMIQPDQWQCATDHMVLLADVTPVDLWCVAALVMYLTLAAGAVAYGLRVLSDSLNSKV